MPRVAQAEFTYERQARIPARHKNIQLDEGFRADILVDRQLIIEVKTVASILPVHQAQVLTYSPHEQFAPVPAVNFHMLRLKDGLRRLVL